MSDAATLVDPVRGEAVGFAAHLRARTAAVHREAERTGFIADLIRGRATRAGYALFLRNLVPVYDALEAALAAAAWPALAPLVASFADPGLHRRAALRADLDAVAGPGWRAAPVLPEAWAYAAAVAAADAPELVAHAYARYLGDLSGGQILKPVLARTLTLGPEALGFYDFPALPALATRKAAIRDALDLVPTDDPAAERIIEGALAAFRDNIAVSDAVSRAAPSLDGVAAG